VILLRSGNVFVAIVKYPLLNVMSTCLLANNKLTKRSRLLVFNSVLFVRNFI
jgi:hypothetical protein